MADVEGRHPPLATQTTAVLWKECVESLGASAAGIINGLGPRVGGVQAQTLAIGINNAGTNNPLPDRPSYSGTGDGYAANRTPSRWFDPASFVVAPAGTFGNVGRNTMLTPHFQSIDMALGKYFHMPYGEHHALQFRLEAFNVFNHPVWGAPNANIRAGAAFPGAPANAAHQGFGVISTTALPMRQLQVGLKYLF